MLKYCSAVYIQNTIERWRKGCIIPFVKKDYLGISKIYWVITLTPIAAKVYNALLFGHIEPEIEKILKKNLNGFQRNRSTSKEFVQKKRKKKLETTVLFINFSKVFDSILRGKMEQIPQAYGLPQRNCHGYNDAPEKYVSKGSLTGWRHRLLWHFAGVLQGDTWALYLFIIWLEYVLCT